MFCTLHSFFMPIFCLYMFGELLLSVTHCIRYHLREYRRKQSLDNAIRERVIGRFVLRVLEGNQAKILTFALGAHTLDAFVTKAKERKILGLDGHQADSVDANSPTH